MKTSQLMLACSFGVLLGLPLVLHGAEPTHAIIPGFERFHADQASSDEAGRLLLGELNCIACHEAEDSFTQSVIPRKAPILTNIGSRVTVDYLRKYLANPQAVKPGTLMPHVLAAVPEKEKELVTESLVHFLASTGSIHQIPPSGAGARRGEQLFHQVGCIACHQPRKGEMKLLTTSVPLGKLDEKYSIPSLKQFLKNPHAVRPSGRMPSLNLNDAEALDIATYLLKDIDVPANLRYTYYEGTFTTLPNFDNAKPMDAGGVTGFDLNIAKRKQNFGLRFEGFLHIQKVGEYTFHLGSDDSSQMFISGKSVIQNRGEHPFAWQSGKQTLQPGVYPLQVDYAQVGGEWVMKVEYEGPGISRTDLASAVTSVKEPPTSDGDAFKLNKELAATGREVFGRLGCIACHEMKSPGKTAIEDFTSKPLKNLQPEAGCLSATPKNVPVFALNDKQREVLNAVLKSPTLTVAEKPTPQSVIHKTLTTFNCYACHSREKRGGVERDREALFIGQIPEMGDEGRIPPLLDGVGDKLNAAWLKHVMAQGANDRPYMLTRMPRFGMENVGPIVAAFETDAKNLKEEVKYTRPISRVKARGRHMVGDKALSCIKCHTFGRHKATGIQSLDLTTMTSRLREDWFRRYMVNPQAYRPGTRMPSAWPNGGTILPEELEGDTDKQLVAIWKYLADGNRAGIPTGIVNDTMELIPIDHPIIYRNFIQGVSPRGIGVGYPERLNLAFDADKIGLAMIWQGSFIDARKHWTGRGQGFQPPAGDAILSLPREVPFAILENDQTAWPTQSSSELGYRFAGYSMNEKRQPAFRYTFHDLKVQDFPYPELGDTYAYFRRDLTVTHATGSPDGLWYRAASGTNIELEKNGWFFVDGELYIRLDVAEGNQKPLIRKVGNRQELLWRIPAGTKTMRIRQDYRW